MNDNHTPSTSGNRTLSSAKTARNDEFYTQYFDIQKEIEAYLEFDPDTFRGKVVYCNCDDPFESNFFKYFAANFNKLGLKRLVTTSYDGSPIAGAQLTFGEYDAGNSKREKPKALAIEVEEVKDINGDGATGIEDVKLFLEQNPYTHTPLSGGGDFRSPECIALLKEADIVVTNPPFSLFRPYIAQLMEHEKKFLIIGNMNAITYKEVFPLIQANRVWLGNNSRVNGGAMFYEIPEAIANLDQVREIKTTENGRKVYITRVQGVRWFTNLDHGRHHEPIQLMSEAEVVRFGTKKPFAKYDNYDAIEVPLVKHIPRDFDGMMGVPISLLDKYNPDQFEILGYEKSYHLQTKKYDVQVQVDRSGNKSNVSKLNDGAAIKVERPPSDQTYYVVDGAYFIQAYKRIFIRHRIERVEGTKK